MKQKEIVAGIVNKKAKFIPKPVFPKSCRCSGTVMIQIIVDQSGNVTEAKGISGHPLLQISAIKSARKAKFPSTLVNGGNQFYVKAILVYKFKPNGTVDF